MNLFTKKELTMAVIVIIFFVLTAYLSSIYSRELESLIGQTGSLGIIFYIFLLILAVVIAPVSFFPLLPIAVTLWGSLAAAIFSIIGWTIGSLVAFIVARNFGRPIVKRLISLERIENLSRHLPVRNIFWSVVFLRMVIPVDILSYALGLFMPLSLFSYTLATLIGITPFAFIFSYTASWPVGYQVAASGLAVIAIFIGLRKVKNSAV